MRVREVMSTGVLTASRADPVRAVVAKMLGRHCGAIPVVEDDDHLVGIVSVRDVLLPLYADHGDYVHDSVHARDFLAMESRYPEVLSRRVEEVMTANPMTVAPNDPVLQAASYMGLRNLRRIPVVDAGRLVGIVSIGDINRALFLGA